VLEKECSSDNSSTWGDNNRNGEGQDGREWKVKMVKVHVLSAAYEYSSSISGKPELHRTISAQLPS
jgi:hypothetical protein